MKIQLVMLWLILTSSTMFMSGITEHDIRKNVNKALLKASEDDDTQTMFRLIKMDGADINTKNAQGRTPLMIAALNGNISAIEDLLDQDPDVDALDANKNTALMLAIDPKKETRINNNHQKIVQALLEHGANPTIKNKDNKDALELLEQKKMNDEVTQQTKITLQRYLDKSQD